MTTSIQLRRVGIDTKDLIEQIKKELPDPEAVLDNAQAVMLNRIRTRFRKQTAPDGSKWPESEAARIRKSGGYTWSNGKKVTGGDTLFATGTLFHSIYAYKKGSGVRAITFDETKAPYGRDHQKGENGQVQRRFIGVGPTDASVVNQVIRRRFGA